MNWTHRRFRYNRTTNPRHTSRDTTETTNGGADTKRPIDRNAARPRRAPSGIDADFCYHDEERE